MNKFKLEHEEEAKFAGLDRLAYGKQKTTKWGMTPMMNEVWKPVFAESNLILNRFNELNQKLNHFWFNFEN